MSVYHETHIVDLEGLVNSQDNLVQREHLYKDAMAENKVLEKEVVSVRTLIFLLKRLNQRRPIEIIQLHIFCKPSTN